MHPTSKLRRFLQALSLLSTITSVLLIVLWVRSYWVADVMEGQLTHRRAFVIDSTCNQLGLHVYRSPIGQPASWRIESVNGRQLSERNGEIFGFFLAIRFERFIVSVPYWFLVLMGIAITTAPWIHWRLRFSVRSLLVGIAVGAIGLVAMRDWVVLNSARDRYDDRHAYWMVGGIRLPVVVEASNQLMLAESNSLFFGHDVAVRNHVDRLKKLVRQSGLRFLVGTRPLEGQMLVEREHDDVVAELEKYTKAAGTEL